MTSRRRIRLSAAVIAVAAAALACATTFTMPAASAAGSTYVNPVAGLPWGRYVGGSDGLYPAYQAATGATKRTLAHEALRPHVRWYTGGIPPYEIAGKVSSDIAAEQNGNRRVVVWMATFDLWPHHESAKARPLTLAEQDRFKRWVNHVAAGIGSSRVAVIVEPDLPVVLTGWRPRVRLGLVRYEVRRYAALPHATVYLDGGSSDFKALSKEIPMLRAAGIAWAHGFALGSTHHPGLASEIRYGRAVSIALARAGVPGKHFVVDSSDNGAGYTWAQFWARYPNGDYNNPPACATRTSRVCVSLGVPPTTDVANSRWGLPGPVARAARHRVDAYMWIARPWLADNGRHFSLAKALQIVRSSRFA